MEWLKGKTSIAGTQISNWSCDLAFATKTLIAGNRLFKQWVLCEQQLVFWSEI